MNRQFAKRGLLPVLFVLLCGFSAAPAQQKKGETALNLPVADQRQIIEILLRENFENAPEATIYLSTANIPEALRKNFAPLVNKTVRFVRPAESAEFCAYEFGEFQTIDKFVSVSFGNCREGLAFDFIKDGGAWKAVSSIYVREMLY
ncbi:MAG TPA: hypothetical protein VIL74_05475 [Pyrinomonadaceae bacterium]|jgi:hypothetical protein